jgi:energy-coupling factor transport system substrate-specific component
MTSATPGIFRFAGTSKIALVFSSAISAIAFLWPFFNNSAGNHPQWIFLCATPFALALLFVGVSNDSLDAKSIALLAILSALIAALRPLGTGAVGIEPMWFVLILSARVFGSSFGFLLGVISMFLSAMVTGGIGPWLGYQCFAAGWIALGVKIVPRKIRGAWEIAALALYGAVAAEFFGIAMDLQFWPWATGVDSQLSFVAGAPLLQNLSRFLSYHFLSSMAWDIPRAIFTSSFILVAGASILATLRRAQHRAAFVSTIEFINERAKAREEVQR